MLKYAILYSLGTESAENGGVIMVTVRQLLELMYEGDNVKIIRDVYEKPECDRKIEYNGNVKGCIELIPNAILDSYVNKIYSSCNYGGIIIYAEGKNEI